MARYDKYDPKVGGFRAFLAEDWDEDTDLNKVWPVGLDVNGHVVKGAGQTGILGVLVITRKMLAADEPVDVMTSGEIVEFPSAAAPAAAGTNIWADVIAGTATVGPVGTVPATATRVLVGHTVESRAGVGARLVVRVTRLTGIFIPEPEPEGP